MTDGSTFDDEPKPAGFGVTDMAQVAQLSGLDYLCAIAEGRLPSPMIAKTLNFRLIEVAEGRAVFTGVPSENHLNPLGTIHGGYVATLLDSALACAVQTLCPVGFASTSVELKVNFVRPIFSNTGRLFARGEVVHPGRQIATSQARLVDEEGKLFAHGTQTCSVFKIPVGKD